MFSTVCKNIMLDAFGVTHLSLHSAYSATGANELTGGSPAYARRAATWGAAASETKALSSALTFDVPGGSTVRYVGKWSALTAGNFLGMEAVGGAEREFYTDTVADTILLVSHGYANGNTVVFYGGAVPGGLVEATPYFVVSAAANTFQVSATLGGAAIDLTAQAGGSCVVARLTAETFAAQGQFQVTGSTQALTA